MNLVNFTNGERGYREGGEEKQEEEESRMKKTHGEF